MLFRSTFIVLLTVSCAFSCFCEIAPEDTTYSSCEIIPWENGFAICSKNYDSSFIADGRIHNTKKVFGLSGNHPKGIGKKKLLDAFFKKDTISIKDSILDSRFIGTLFSAGDSVSMRKYSVYFDEGYGWRKIFKESTIVNHYGKIWKGIIISLIAILSASFLFHGRRCLHWFTATAFMIKKRMVNDIIIMAIYPILIIVMSALTIPADISVRNNMGILIIMLFLILSLVGILASFKMPMIYIFSVAFPAITLGKAFGAWQGFLFLEIVLITSFIFAIINILITAKMKKQRKPENWEGMNNEARIRFLIWQNSNRKRSDSLFLDSIERNFINGIATINFISSLEKNFNTTFSKDEVEQLRNDCFSEILKLLYRKTKNRKEISNG